MNLAHNAIKFTPAGGHVRVEATERENGSLQIAVADTGPGIAEQDVSKVFEKFYTGQTVLAETRGAGLGLAISERLVKLHDSHITVETAPDKGARFYFDLPRRSASGIARKCS